ncbi:MAG: 4-(cytidine 5'-diphospho)-2-C-methyl-D-erythritol kinase [Lachnospiraceae bacterium]|nr:4-(cytidine 5'-diphospho)-2-C-methyl-D-erythritol kinase [Lachnospiraceae bacterium]
MREHDLSLQAYAKVNLGLDVVRRLENGYHEVKMIMQTVDIADTLYFNKIDSGIQVTVEGEFIEGGIVPADENNLIYKAAKQMFETYRIQGGVAIHLVKRIPVAAGMAGGSTDAAATYRGINQLFEVGASIAELEKLAVKVGADVPYCISGGTALSEGIGEVLTALPDAPECVLLVAKPDISVSTKYVYENLNLPGVANHPDIDGMVKAIKAREAGEVWSRMANVLETVTVKAYPIIEEIKDVMRQEGAIQSLMSGSGPTVFGIYDDTEKAQKARDFIVEKGLARQVFVSRFVNPGKEE